MSFTNDHGDDDVDEDVKQDCQVYQRMMPIEFTLDVQLAGLISLYADRWQNRLFVDDQFFAVPPDPLQTAWRCRW